LLSLFKPISDEVAREALVYWRELVKDGLASADGNALNLDGSKNLVDRQHF
jgi:hypothetical protein